MKCSAAQRFPCNRPCMSVMATSTVSIARPRTCCSSSANDSGGSGLLTERWYRHRAPPRVLAPLPRDIDGIGAPKRRELIHLDGGDCDLAVVDARVRAVMFGKLHVIY